MGALGGREESDGVNEWLTRRGEGGAKRKDEAATIPTLYLEGEENKNFRMSFFITSTSSFPILEN